MTPVAQIRERAIAGIKALGLEVTDEREKNYLAAMVWEAAHRISTGYARAGVSREELASIINAKDRPTP